MSLDSTTTLVTQVVREVLQKYRVIHPAWQSETSGVERQEAKVQEERAAYVKASDATKVKREFKKLEDAGDEWTRSYVEFYWRRLTGEGLETLRVSELLKKVTFVPDIQVAEESPRRVCLSSTPQPEDPKLHPDFDHGLELPLLDGKKVVLTFRITSSSSANIQDASVPDRGDVELELANTLLKQLYGMETQTERRGGDFLYNRGNHLALIDSLERMGSDNCWVSIRTMPLPFYQRLRRDYRTMNAADSSVVPGSSPFSSLVSPRSAPASEAARVKFVELGPAVAEFGQWMLPISYVGVRLFYDKHGEDPHEPCLAGKDTRPLPVTFASRSERKNAEKKYCNVLEALVGTLSVDEVEKWPPTLRSPADKNRVSEKGVEAEADEDDDSSSQQDEDEEQELDASPVAGKTNRPISRTPTSTSTPSSRTLLSVEEKVKLLKRLCGLAVSVLAVDVAITGLLDREPPGRGFTSIDRIWETRKDENSGGRYDSDLVAFLQTLRVDHEAALREIEREIRVLAADFTNDLGNFDDDHFSDVEDEKRRGEKNALTSSSSEVRPMKSGETNRSLRDDVLSAFVLSSSIMSSQHSNSNTVNSKNKSLRREVDDVGAITKLVGWLHDELKYMQGDTRAQLRECVGWTEDGREFCFLCNKYMDESHTSSHMHKARCQDYLSYRLIVLTNKSWQKERIKDDEINRLRIHPLPRVNLNTAVASSPPSLPSSGSSSDMKRRGRNASGIKAAKLEELRSNQKVEQVVAPSTGKSRAKKNRKEQEQSQDHDEVIVTPFDTATAKSSASASSTSVPLSATNAEIKQGTVNERAKVERKPHPQPKQLAPSFSPRTRADPDPVLHTPHAPSPKQKLDHTKPAASDAVVRSLVLQYSKGGQGWYCLLCKKPPKGVAKWAGETEKDVTEHCATEDHTARVLEFRKYSIAESLEHYAIEEKRESLRLKFP
ncbi:unnamed protein product [Amoebophrya sp. A25]|nr:unnamed protein product [Amoebophrya sp. A25]|eukprot:GSA25T00018809001.1